MKERLPTIVTAVLIVGALFFFAQRNGRETKAPATPEEVIWRMSDASREGEVEVYLNCFSGELRRKMERTVTEMGEAQFKQYLKKLNEEITGIAVSDLVYSDHQTATLRVEFVFRGKNEAQKHHFKLIDGTWRIDSVENAERVNTLIPYGREVEAEQPR